MQILLLRCGSLATDAAPHLSALGRQLSRAIGNKLKHAAAPEFANVLTSAAPNCVQTAELFAERVDFLGLVEVSLDLSAAIPAHVLAPRILTLAAAADERAILVVGDEPWLSALGASLIGRPTFPQLMHAQVSAIEGGKPTWFFRADAMAKAPLLVA